MALTQMYDGKNNSPQTALSANITADDSVIPVSDISVIPSAPNLATIGNDDNAEVIRYTGISGSTLINCERGFGGTTKKSWDAETVISRQITKYDFDAIQSNITELNTTKQDTLTFDTAPTAGSANPVTSGGVKTALDEKQDTLPAYDTAPTANSTNIVTSGGVKTALDGKTNLSQVAPEFSTSTAYAIDDLVIYQGALYRFKATHAAGAWNAAHVTACTISEVISHFAKFRITGTVSSGNMTLTDARIDSEHWRVPNGGIYFGTPSNVTSGINWSTNITQHTITISATYSAATSVIVELEWMQN